MKRFLQALLLALLCIVVILFIFSYRAPISHIEYGVSFSKLHSDDLGLNWKETYLAILDDLKVRHLRLSAHWPMIEPKDGVFNFDEMDFQMGEAGKRNADVVLAVGRRLPSWPECHDPAWVAGLSVGERQKKQLQYMTEVVNRYKNAPNLKYWQVENEPFLYFAPQYCGTFDEAFFQTELSLVRSLDPNHPILVTDSGELGRWYKAKGYGDAFGTSLYLYVYYEHVGFMRYPITPGFFRIKQNITDLMVGSKPSLLIELGAEPWLQQPIASTTVDMQLQHMDLPRIQSIVSFASETGFSEQYLWGAEWWYYMKGKGHSEIWEGMKKLYSGNAQ